MPIWLFYFVERVNINIKKNMTVAILSDIHDNIWKLEDGLKHCADADHLIFCGDFCSPFSLEQMGRNFSNSIHAVFGNNDGDRFLLTKVANKFPHFNLYGEIAKIEIAGLKMVINHYPDIAYEIAENTNYDVVFYGHNHKMDIKRIKDTQVINPGEIMGRFGKSTIVLMNCLTRKTRVIEF